MPRIVDLTPRSGGVSRPGLATLAIAALLLVDASRLPGQTPVEVGAGGIPAGDPDHTTLVHPPFAHTLGIHRARPIHLKIFLGDRTRFDDPQGVTAVKFASDDDPDARVDDFQLTLLGVNAGRGEIMYNSSMQTLAVFGREGSDEGMFHRPRGIEATTDGRIYVADTGNRRVARLRWDPVARSIRWVGTWSADQPVDVAADARGQVFVADHGADAVLRIPDTLAGAAAGFWPTSPITGDRWPLPDDVDRPVALAVGDSLDPWFKLRAYRLYLVDRNGARLRAYEADGTVIAETAPGLMPDPDPRGGRFSFVELDYFGNVYVTDPVGSVVHKFDPRLELLTSFPGVGEGWALEEPRGIAIWKRFGQVFVAEREGAQYFFIGTDFQTFTDPLRIERSSNGSSFSFDILLTEAATVRVTFMDQAGDTLAMADAGIRPAGEQEVRWGRGSWVSPLAGGWEERADRVAIEARPTYSSRKRFSRIRILAFVWTDS